MAPLMAIEMCIHVFKSFLKNHLVSENLKQVFPFDIAVPPLERDQGCRQRFTC